MTTRVRRPHILITGLPGVGKTTLIRKLSGELADLHPVGFYTEEIREGRERVGFSAVSLDGRLRQVLSHVRIPGPDRVGRYGVDVAGFEQFLDRLDLGGNPSPLIVMDEIGKMECLSSRFTGLVMALLDSPKQVVATIGRKDEGFIRQVKQRPDLLLFEVQPHNRDGLLPELTAQVREGMNQAGPV